MPRLSFIATGEGIESLYEDRIDYERFQPPGSDLTIRRNSVVNPVASGLGFVIRWLDPALIAIFGEQTDRDNQGRPFRSHCAAVRYEVELINKEYFKLRPST